MNNEVSAKGLEATLKSTDTEEWIDLLSYRLSLGSSVSSFGSYS